MAERKTKLAHVAFGGDWSETRLTTEELRDVLSVIGDAVQKCAERDVRDDPELNEALSYVEQRLGRGSELAKAFRVALDEPVQTVRVERAADVHRRMCDWAGV